jgi:hypothetical protein
MQKWWSSLKTEEQVAWYRKQTRVAAEKGKPRDLSMSFEAKTLEAHSVQKGRRRKHDLIPYGIYYQRQTALNKTEHQIQQQWKDMLLNPEVDRETVTIDGQPELCIEVSSGPPD